MYSLVGRLVCGTFYDAFVAENLENGAEEAFAVEGEGEILSIFSVQLCLYGDLQLIEYLIEAIVS